MWQTKIFINMKPTNLSIRVLWVVLMVWIAHTLAFLGWEIISSPYDGHSFHHLLKHFTQFLCDLGVLFIGFCLYRLWKKYQKQSFFDEESVKTVRTMGIILMLISIPNTTFNVLRDVILPSEAAGHLPAHHVILHRFFLDFLFQSPVFLFLGMLIFLFADFMKKAINIKNDKETII